MLGSSLFLTLALGLASADDILVVTGWNGGQTADSDVWLEFGGDDCSIPDFPDALQSAVGWPYMGATPFICGGLKGYECLKLDMSYQW